MEHPCPYCGIQRCYPEYCNALKNYKNSKKPKKTKEKLKYIKQ